MLSWHLRNIQVIHSRILLKSTRQRIDMSIAIVLQTRAPLAAGRELVGDYNRLLNVLYVLNIKLSIFQSVLHIPVWKYFDISLIYPKDFVVPNLL